MNAMEQAVKKAFGMPKNMTVKITNEDAIRLLNAIVHNEKPATASFSARGDRAVDIHLELDGQPLTHKIVLDARGVWHVQTVVAVEA